tara:strand:+ start:1036 stop:2871 length:1836 start_codon:yes stop_codon:yes gene_type:complete
MADDDNIVINQDSYVAFDAVSLKDLIIERLNANNNFTDQNYEGSNLSSLLDVICYSFHTLIYYLNKNSAETSFTQAEIYENINQIVKTIDYNPTGPQTPNLNFKTNALAELPSGLYTIPRYSYFTFSGTSYSFNEDVAFNKLTDLEEQLDQLGENNLLYNGTFVEYPSFAALGENFEVSVLAPSDIGSNIIIDSNNIFVYVKPNTLNSKWEQWSRTTSLYLENASAKKFSVRFNENERYEIKFGNNITGKRLNPGDIVAIYYLRSDGANGVVSKDTINNQPLYFYTTNQFNEILGDIVSPSANLLTIQQSSQLKFSNDNPSTNFRLKESVIEIKQNAPNLYNSQYRLVTINDYNAYISKNFGSWVKSVECADNFRYTDQYLNYFFDLGLDRPNDDSRVLYNQINFSTSCDFNNVYVFAVPNKTLDNSTDIRTNYLSTSQKNAITNLLGEAKSATSEIVISDPVYVELNFASTVNDDDYDKFLPSEIGDSSFLYVEIANNSRRDVSSVQSEVAQVFKNYFNTSNLLLGQVISIAELNQSINNIDGVVKFSTRREYNGKTLINRNLSIIATNPVYEMADNEVYQQDISLPFFKFAYFKNLSDISSKITVVRQG